MRVRRVTVGVLAAVLLAAGAVAAFHAGGRWDPLLVGLLLCLVVAADLQEIRFKSVSVTGNFLGIVLAMALLGPAPAMILAVLSNAVWAVRSRAPLEGVLITFASYAASAVAGALVMRWAADAMGVRIDDIGFAVAVLAGFAVAHVVNFSVVFAGRRIKDGMPFWKTVRTVIVPLLPSDAVMVLLASLIVYAEAHVGPVALGMLIVLFFLYLYLYRELVISQERAEELQSRTEELASLQVGILTAMLRTLSMRDQMTARHSAAVARYTREIAKAAGLSEQEQDLAHTAALLHDIGKFILPDHILVASTKLTEEDWQTIRMHPYQGARVVREVEGYGPVADIICCHHERVDGKGYPRRIAGDDIPLISRMISIADTYDVMTSRDSYRDPVSSQAAIDELRRVSGAQLDGELVELFVGVLESKGLAFRHADDADFEAELAFDRRVRDYAAPRGELQQPVLPATLPAAA